MRLKILATLFSLLFFAVSYSQVQFKNISFREALEQAKAADKIVLLIIESADCSECNAVATQGFANPVLARAVNNSCIAVKIGPGSNDMGLLDSLYHTGNSFGLLFINSDGNFLHRYTGSTSFYITYMEQLDKALNIKEHPDAELAQLQNDYNSGKRSFSLLYELVAKRNAQDLEHDQLTEEMLNLAPTDSANSLTFIQFLAEQAPVVDSKVDKYMRNDTRNFHDAWYLMPSQKRVSLNGKIIYKSNNKAIKEKNFVYALRVAAFKGATYTDNLQSRRYRDKSIIDYYKGIKDTINFLQAASRYYDQYLMTISVDSVKQADSLRLKELFNAPPPPSADKLMTPGNTPVLRNTARFAPATQYYTNELNDAAWTIYTYTHDPFYTNKALIWAKRANEFFDNPGAMDTYARLLYRSGNKEEAIAWEEKSVRSFKERKVPPAIYGDYEVILAKMKNSASMIDKY